jgi:uncharacterized protein YndB with AHSA1/START domain
MHCTVTRTLSAPPDRVYAMLTDLEGTAGQMRAILRFEKLTPGPTRVGTRWRETRKMFGREASAEMEIKRLEPPRRIEKACEEQGCAYLTVFELQPDGAGRTRVTLTFTAEATGVMGWLMKPMGALLKGTMRKVIEADFDDLERVATGAAAPAG